MFDLMNWGNILPQVLMPEVKIRDLKIAMEPSDIFLLPTIRIDAKIDIRFP